MIAIRISCSYNIEDELYPTVGCDVADMSYSQDILPLIVSQLLRIP